MYGKMTHLNDNEQYDGFDKPYWAIGFGVGIVCLLLSTIVW